MPKKLLILLSFLVLMLGAFLLVSPKARSKAQAMALGVVRTTVSAVQQISRRPTGTTTKSIVTDNCTYKEFSDVTSPTDPNYGWAYWYLHSAKQNGILGFSDSTCLSGTIDSRARDKVLLSDVCQVANRTLGQSASCPIGDGDSYTWMRYLNVSNIKTELAKRGIGGNNPPTPAGSSAPSWSETGCVCQVDYCWLLNCQKYTCDECESNGDSGGSCTVSGPTYTGGCSTKAHLIALADFNANKPISYKIQGEIGAANGTAAEAATLSGTKVEIYELNSSGLPTGSPIGSTTISYSAGVSIKYELTFTKNIAEFISTVPGKRYEIMVTPGSSDFYPDARVFTISRVSTTLNFSLLQKEEFTGQIFSDVAPENWYYWYVTAMSQNRIMGGFDGQFYPNYPVTRARTALYSTLAKGALPCCGVEVDPGTQTACQACTGWQFYDDLVPSNYFWGYAQSALLAGTMTGYYEAETGGMTFRPTEDIIQSQVWLTMQKGGIANPEIPSDYSPGFSGGWPINRAQMAALYAWNFNPEISIRISGQLAVKDGAKPLSDLTGADVMLSADGHGLYAEKITGDVANGNYEVTFKAPFKEMMSQVLGKEVSLDFSKAGFTSATQNVVIGSTNTKVDFTAVVERTITFHGVVKYWTDCAGGTQPLSGININIVNESSARINDTGALNYDSAAGTITYSINVRSASPTDAAGNPVAEVFDITPEKEGILPKVSKVTVPPGQIDINFDVIAIPTEVTFKGRVFDAGTHQPVEAAGVSRLNDKTGTDVGGYYSLKQEILQKDNIPVFFTFSVWAADYVAKVSTPIKVLGCPIQYVDFKLESVPECQSYNNVKICFFGDEAKRWRRDPTLAPLWQDLSNKFNRLVQETGLRTMAGFNVMSGSYNAWADYANNGAGKPWAGNEITLGTTLMKAFNGDPLSQSSTTQRFLAHEFGHILFETPPAQAGKWTTDNVKLFKTFWGQGGKIGDWSLITDSFYFTWGGHPWDGPYEVFASTFCVMEGANAEFLATINSQTNADRKSWLKNIYNWHANNWASSIGVKPLAYLQKVIASFQ